MSQEEITLIAEDSHKIFIRCWKPSRKKIKGIVHIAHGMAEHSGRYAETAKPLCKAGFIVFAHDHRGHGYSIEEETKGHYADKNGWRLVKSDMNQIHNYIKENNPELPLFLLAHSMGSFISMSYLIDFKPKLAGVLLSGSNFDSPIKYKALKPIIRSEKFRIGSKGLSPIIRFIIFGRYNIEIKNPTTDHDWLSKDKAEVDKYLNDGLCGFRCTNQLWDDLIDGLISISSTDQLKKIESNLPIYLFAGLKDPVGGYGEGVKRLTNELVNSGHTDITCKLYPGGRHELLNETNKAEVIDNLVNWLVAKL